MDLLQDLTPFILQAYHQASPYLIPLLSTLSRIRTTLTPLLTPYLDLLAQHAQSSPAAFSVFIFLAFLLTAVYVLNLVRRIMMWWVRFLTRLVFWAAVVGVIALVMRRGVGETVDDVVEWGRVLGEVWWREYRRWEGYQNQSQSGSGQGVGGAYGAGRNMGGVNARASWR